MAVRIAVLSHLRLCDVNKSEGKGVGSEGDEEDGEVREGRLSLEITRRKLWL